MYHLVLLRHGESVWNRENRFTGWADVDLSPQGEDEARAGGRLLKEGGWSFDLAFCSVLTRANRTLNIVLEEMGLSWIEVRKSWRLNERHYGALQGLNKAETAALHGEAQVKVWRRSYDIAPPAMNPEDPAWAGRDVRYKDLGPEEIPLSECLKDTVARVLPYWEAEIAPAIRSGRRVLVAAHGNSLRALVKYLDHLPESQIVELNIPTATPLVYDLDESLRPLGHRYLGDATAIQAAIDAVANQGKK